MKYFRILGVFFCLFLTLCGSALAATDEAIDLSTVADGYFTVSFDGEATMKVGITHDGTTTYRTYLPGQSAAYALTEGDGRYSITLYKNLSGTTYAPVAQATADVVLRDPLAPYLVSTAEITFCADDAVGQTAADLCEGLDLDAEKVVAIHNYIAKNFRYDFIFAAAASNGQIVNYVTDTNASLASRCGVCCDFAALFAAMCRSQGIACKLVEGELETGTLHAWNLAYVDGEWVALDLTASIFQRLVRVDSLSNCTRTDAAYFKAA